MTIYDVFLFTVRFGRPSLRDLIIIVPSSELDIDGKDPCVEYYNNEDSLQIHQAKIVVRLRGLQHIRIQADEPGDYCIFDERATWKDDTMRFEMFIRVFILQAPLEVGSNRATEGQQRPLYPGPRVCAGPSNILLPDLGAMSGESLYGRLMKEVKMSANGKGVTDSDVPSSEAGLWSFMASNPVGLLEWIRDAKKRLQGVHGGEWHGVLVGNG
ncbi:hypothetical protein LTR78_002390 [Recurvomyces mirabilis]|uniref:Uncharacterized protein n=1 Tax=Recurvomyces mirabilis TaxID=574656 RepID=A0AAE0WTY0_9PEZI|nr:hypothetical protein LTR78_002390 [Recurvomyces mirabilis]KAK5157319.1 hypothetical protein LTS14_004084 [Recurvomyces mirabilis]